MTGRRRLLPSEKPEAPAEVRRWVARVTGLLERHFGKPDPEKGDILLFPVKPSSAEPVGAGRVECPLFREEDPLEVLLHTILSQNTNDTLRDRAYDRLRERFPTDEALSLAPVRSIASAIRVCGLHRQKAQRIKRVLRWTRGRFGGLSLQALCLMPTEEAFAALASVNGVGPKTAAVVLLFGCGRDIFPVDTHCHRTVRRLGLVPWKLGREQTFRAMQPLVPKGKALSLHLNLIHLGRTICRAPRPRCCECPLVEECRFPDKVMEPLAPSRRPSPTGRG